MKLKTFFTEFAILFALLALTCIVVSGLIHYKYNGRPVLDTASADTYFALEWNKTILQPFLMLATIVYLIREGFYAYRRRFQNIILLLSNFIFIVQLSKLFSFINLISIAGRFSNVGGVWTRGRTIYPPLSGLGDTHDSESILNLAARLNQVVSIVFFVFLLILVISAILTGKNWNAKPYEAKQL